MMEAVVSVFQYLFNYRNWFTVFSTAVTFLLLKRLIWKPFKLYVLAQYLPGVNLKGQGQWAVVTGSTDGIGKAYARALASRGLDVVLISRSDERLDKVKQEIVKEYKCRVRTIQADFSRTDIYEKIEEELAGLDIGVLINNVGATHKFMSFLEFSNMAEEEEKLTRVNCTSTVRMTSLVLPSMTKKGKGVIVSLSSCLAHMPMDGVSLYAATKSFVYTFTKTVRFDCRKFPGIIIQTLTPGITATNLFSDLCTEREVRKKLDMATVTPDRLVSYAINPIGWADDCDGHPIHWLFTRVMSISDYL